MTKIQRSFIAALALMFFTTGGFLAGCKVGSDMACASIGASYGRELRDILIRVESLIGARDPAKAAKFTDVIFTFPPDSKTRAAEVDRMRELSNELAKQMSEEDNDRRPAGK